LDAGNEVLVDYRVENQTRTHRIRSKEQVIYLAEFQGYRLFRNVINDGSYFRG